MLERSSSMVRTTMPSQSRRCFRWGCFAGTQHKKNEQVGDGLRFRQNSCVPNADARSALEVTSSDVMHYHIHITLERTFAKTVDFGEVHFFCPPGQQVAHGNGTYSKCTSPDSVRKMHHGKVFGSGHAFQSLKRGYDTHRWQR